MIFSGKWQFAQQRVQYLAGGNPVWKDANQITSSESKECCFFAEILSEILKIGIPTLIFQILTSLSIAMINGASKEYGGSALSAMEMYLLRNQKDLLLVYKR